MAGGAQQVNLMGPNVSLPPEMQASQAQLQIQQEIAQALIAKSLEAYSPVIHTGGNNPFARDVPNIGGPMAQIANALFGQKQLEDVGPKQQALAQRYQDLSQFEQSEIMRNVTGYDQGVPGPDGQTPVHVPGDVLRAASVKTVTPIAQQLKDSLLKAFVESQQKSAVTPENVLAGGRNFTGPSIANSIVPRLFGNGLDPSKLVNKSTDVLGPGGAVGTIQPLPGAQVQPAGVIQPPKQPVVNPGGETPTGDTNQTGGTLTYEPTGVPKVLETPATKVATTTGEERLKELQTSRDSAQKYATLLPNMLQSIKLIGNSDLRFGGEQVTQARMLATSMGLSNDDAQKIVDTQTFIKNMVPLATAATRDFSSRPSQNELSMIARSLAAGQEVDPRTAKNILMKLILDGQNKYTQHENNIDQAKAELPQIGKSADSYRIKNFPTVDDLTKQMDSAGIPFTISQDAKSKLLTNAEVGHNGPLNKTTPPQGALDKLKANPGLAAAFDEKYGAGSSAMILGK